MSTPVTPCANRPFRPVWRVALAACGLCWSVLSFGADPAATLRNRYGDLSEQLKRNPFNRPLYLESSEESP